MIDEEITFMEKGYYSTDLKPNSHKPVYAICEGDNCEREGGRCRWVRFYAYRDFCRSCASKNRNILKDEDRLDKLPWIDDEITFREKGYRSTELKLGSNKPVWAICANPNCEREGGRGRWVRYQNCSMLCHSCAQKERHFLKEYERTEKYDCIDDEKTFAEKGYRSTDLKPKSSKEVWRVCAGCGEGAWIQFSQYHDLCNTCSTISESRNQKLSKSHIGKIMPYYIRIKIGDAQLGEKNHNWKGGISIGDYCKFFDEPLKDAVRNYFDNICFNCDRDIEENGNRKMSVHHVNYQKDCGCDNTQFCIYVPLCNKCHGESGHNRWYWYIKFITELALMNPNYYAYHIPVVFYDEPSYNYSYVFEKNRKRGV